MNYVRSAILFITAPLVFGAPWTRLATPHFEIYTDAGERAARSVLVRFEQAQRVLASAHWKPAAESTRILLFASSRDYATIRPAANVTGFYQSGAERDYIILASGSELDRVIFHEYTHLVLNHSCGHLPQWLEEGLAEFYSTLQPEANRAVVGAPVGVHVNTLARSKWLSPAELAAVDQRSEYYNEAGKTGVFYAQSWALTHMLILGESYRGKLSTFIEKWTSGAGLEPAFQESFGRSWEQALRDLRGYVRAGFPSIAVDVPPAGEIVFSQRVELDPVAAIQARGEILLLNGRNRDAQRLYEGLARRYPASPTAQTGLAVIAMRDHDARSARRFFERALALGARDASTYFEYAMLLRDTGADPEQVNDFLERAIAANPSYAEAHFLLGIRASDAGRYSDALAHLQRATEILPRQAYFWQALSYAQFKLGHRPEARDAALRALNCAGTAHEREMAQAALDLFNEPVRTDLPRQEGVVTPNSWQNRRGDRTVTGTLIRVDCEEAAATLYVRAGGETLVLRVTDPSKVVIRGGPARTSIACGSQKGTPVRIEYQGETRSVTAIDFR